MVYLVTIILLFLLIFYQDLRFRGIHWIVFPALLLCSVLLKKENLNIEMILFNLGFLATLLLLLTFYLSIKFQRFVDITKGFFSLGDILFLIALIPLFSSQLYMTYFIVGTILSLGFHLIASTIKAQKNLPFAGYMALSGILFVICEQQVQGILNHFFVV